MHYLIIIFASLLQPVMLDKLRIDNRDFRVNGLVFTFLLIYLKLYDIFYTKIHQMKAEIIGYRIIPMT